MRRLGEMALVLVFATLSGWAIVDRQLAVNENAKLREELEQVRYDLDRTCDDHVIQHVELMRLRGIEIVQPKVGVEEVQS